MKKYSEKKIKRLKNLIISILTDSETPLNYKQITAKLFNKKNKGFDILSLLNKMVVEKKLLINDNYKFYVLKKNINITKGFLEYGEKKEIYCRCEKTNCLIHVPKKNIKGGLIHDYVLIKILKNKRRVDEGVVEKIIKRDKEFFVGTFSKKNNTSFVIPIDKNIKTDFYIPRGDCLNAKNNDRVLVKILEWPERAKCPFGKITEIIGESGSFSTEILSIIKKHGIETEFSKESLECVKGLNEKIIKKDIENRRDFREEACFTIDPDDAKDFDDAVSVKKINTNTFEIGVHIADVSHYVKPNTALDKDAIKRGCSVYLADRVIPMLPEKLANKLCSLRPNEEKLCFSTVFIMNTNGEIISDWLGKTIIKSKKRFTYNEAQNVINSKQGEFFEELSTLNNLAEKLRAKRIREGSVILEKKEVYVEFVNEMPVKPYFKKIISTNKLIEEFMLLSNKFVCKYFNNNEGVYRVHDKPDLEKLKSLKIFLKSIDVEFNISENKLYKSINELLKKIENNENKYLINQLVLQSMSKAEYSVKNIGHFGLGFNDYTHFTSPIRRYPDILVHRILNEKLQKKKNNINNLKGLCLNSSKKERAAIKAEREYLKFILLWLIKDKVGKTTPATIISIKDWGIYAELDDYLCEGMISLKNLKKEGNFYYCNKKNEMINKINGESLYLGKKLMVTITSINLQRGELDIMMD